MLSKDYGQTWREIYGYIVHFMWAPHGGHSDTTIFATAFESKVLPVADFSPSGVLSPLFLRSWLQVIHLYPIHLSSV